MHLQPAFTQAPHTDMPVSNAIWHRILTLPCSTGISDAELERVVSTVIEVLA
jgi:dTDP-4-amino-4,6-dideoxygalactose transaminase